MFNVLGGVAGLMALVLLVLAIRNHRRRIAMEVVEEPPKPTLGAYHDEAGRGRMLKLGGVLKPSDKKAIEELKNRVTQAGLYSRDAVDLYLTVKLTMMLGGLIISLMMISTVEDPPVSVLIFLFWMGIAVVGPGIWLSSRTRARQLEIMRALPSTVDLLVTCLEAGLGLEQAMERVSDPARHSDDLLATEMHITLSEMKAGLETATAWKKFAARIGLEDVNTLTAVITQAAALGTNIAGLLRDHARTMRQHRLLQLEEQAGKANAKLTLPLTTCLLPAVMILLLGPAVIAILNTL